MVDGYQQIIDKWNELGEGRPILDRGGIIDAFDRVLDCQEATIRSMRRCAERGELALQYGRLRGLVAWLVLDAQQGEESRDGNPESPAQPEDGDLAPVCGDIGGVSSDAEQPASLRDADGGLAGEIGEVHGASITDYVRARQAFSPELARETRRVAGLSAAEVADCLGVSRQTVSNWERGTRTPRGPLLVAYVDLLKEIRRSSAAGDS